MRNKLYLLFAIAMAPFMGAFAQINVTFQVDMAEQASLGNTVADSVTVAGNFQAAAGLGSDWTPGAAVMVDTTTGDSVFTLTFSVPQGTYQYKFINGVAWGSDESVPGACNVSGNRELNLSSFAGTDTIVPLVCFASCDTCPPSGFVPDTLNVTLLVNMRNEDPIADTVSVAGNFQGVAGFSDWTPGATVLTDTAGGVADSIYEVTVRIPEGTYAYKFINGTAWGFDEGIPAACNVGGNREMIITATASGDTTIGPVCFATCQGTCPEILPPINVTFQVDMSNEILSDSGVFVAGNFQSPAWQKNMDMLTDPDGNGIYTFTTSLLRAEYEFKFFNGANGDPSSDEFSETADFFTLGCGNGGFGNNRWVDLTNAAGDTILPAWEYNSCTETVGVGIGDDLGKDNLKVYPNPFTHTTTVEFSNAFGNIYDFSIITLTGKVVRRIEGVNSDKVEINRGDLAAGVYILTISNRKGESLSKKLVIQ